MSNLSALEVKKLMALNKGFIHHYPNESSLYNQEHLFVGKLNDEVFEELVKDGALKRVGPSDDCRSRGVFVLEEVEGKELDKLLGI